MIGAMLFRALAVVLLFAAPAKTPQALLAELGKAYATDAKVEFGGVELGKPSTVTSATLDADKKRVLSALRVGYAPDGKKSFQALPWSDLREVLSVTSATGSPEDAVNSQL